MQNKEYFTAEIEDFCIGYEYETIYLKSVWTKESLRIMDAGWFFESYQNDAVPTEFRVLYLTKKQIEAEGWVFVIQQDDFNQIYTKTIKDFNYTLYYYENYTSKEQEITIEINFKATNQSNKLISGALCRDINTFRKLQKLLKLQ